MALRSGSRNRNGILDTWSLFGWLEGDAAAFVSVFSFGQVVFKDVELLEDEVELIVTLVELCRSSALDMSADEGVITLDEFERDGLDDVEPLVVDDDNLTKEHISFLNCWYCSCAEFGDTIIDNEAGALFAIPSAIRSVLDFSLDSGL